MIERQPKNKDELMAVLEEEWWKLPQGFIIKLIDSMKERIERCIARNGGRFEKVI